MTAAAIARRTPPSSALPSPLPVLLPLMMVLLLLLPLPQRTTAGGGGEEKICNSVVVRNTGDRLAALHNCTTINGFVHIVLLDATKPSDFEVSFPMLREITQYMVVYRVSGLSSLGKLFPNLTLIRGIRTTDFPGLALMIHDNADLTEVGLHSLTNITQGSVIITNNPKLCYSTTIDWGQITNGVANETNIISNNENRRCREGCANQGCPDNRCWSAGHCQYGRLKDCHPLCAGGCYEPHSARHCYACTAFLHNGECIRECPPNMYGHIRVCLTADQCRNLEVVREESTPDDLNTHYIPFEHLCRDECPYWFEPTADKKGCAPCTKTKGGNCKRNCNSFKITDEMLSRNAAYRLHTNCTTIRSLEIEVKYGTSEDVERRLEEYIGKVEVIYDQLKIIRSYSLTSLNFLRNLHEIRGENTVNKMALVVRGNKNLQKLWTRGDGEDAPPRPVRILNGTVSFHYNPKLCMSEVYKFGNLSTLPPFTDLEVSNISNGDQFACTVYNLQVETVKIESQSIVLRMHKPVEVDDLERFLVYFIEASKWNATVDTETECEDSSWKIDDISSKKPLNETVNEQLNETVIEHLITNLEPNTEYVYYVKTYTISSKTSMSSVFRNKTLPSKPSAPQYFAARPVSSDRVELTWKPPSHPHGKLVRYVIKGLHLNDDQAILDQRSYCKNRTFSGTGVTRPASSMLSLSSALLSSSSQSQSSSSGSSALSSSLSPVAAASSSASASATDQTCEKQCEPQKNAYDVCDTFEHGIDIDVIPADNRKYTFEMCANFLNIFINEKCMALQQQYAADDTYFQSGAAANAANCSELWTVTDEPRNMYGPDGGLTRLHYELDDTSTSFNLSGLKHYSRYVLSISVCREVVDQEYADEMRRATAAVDSCSRETLISFRTGKNESADVVDAQRIRVDVNNRTVNVSWDAPKLVNSIIHSYQLEYKRAEHQSYTAVCITAKEYETAGRSYAFKNLLPGDYEFKIRAVSLAGDGPATDVFRFTVADAGSLENVHLVLMILVCGCVLIVLTGVIIRTYFSRKLSERNSAYNLARNNPAGYVGIYVEDEWELAREDVIIQKILGRGTFGTVHEGVLMPDNVPCAVKSVSKTNFLRYHAEFLNEAAIMKKFSEAYHIVKLLGVVTKSHPPLLVMELMGRGDLKSVLVKSKESDSPPPPNRYTIIRMAAQIADGMAFLEYNKFIHRDLAARNCMVANDMTVKIGDFGMSRQIYTGDYYRKGNKGEMPIRWMAPESLSEGIFTSQSDVWSYGVVIWEMMTLGLQPYAGKSNNEVMAHVLDGYTLNLPVFCPDVLASIVRMCWKWTASQRPKFLKIVESLDAYLDDNFRSVSFYHNRGADDDSPADHQSLMSPCTTYEDDADNDESIGFEGTDTVAVYNAFHVDQNKMSNGHLPPM